MNNLEIKGRFKNYNHLVVGKDRNIYQLSHFIFPRTLPFRRLKFYTKRNAYGFNGSYISKSRLESLYYASNETINKKLSNNL